MPLLSKKISKIVKKYKKSENIKNNDLEGLELSEKDLKNKKIKALLSDLLKLEKDIVEIESYDNELEHLQTELTKLQSWVVNNKKRVVIIFEGRDTAGKGGTIKRISEHLNPRICRVVALAKPTEEEKGQWYFQRYIKQLPNVGEIVLFDRSWYNRAGVEKVFNYCTEKDYQLFLDQVTKVEDMLIDSGIILIKYYLSITKDEQESRLQARLKSDLKRWKISEIDLKSGPMFSQYTKAKEAMFENTHTNKSPWYIVNANDKKTARVNVIKHLIKIINYSDDCKILEHDKNIIKSYK